MLLPLIAFVCGIISPSLALQCSGKSTCVGLKQCGHFVDFLGAMEKPLKPSVVFFLRSRQCGFHDGYPRVCCAAIPKNLKVFEAAPSFDIVVSTAPPHATPIPYFQENRKHHKFWPMEENHLDYDLFRRRRSPNGIDIEIR